MFQNFLSQLNYGALITATVVYFILGAFWFSPALFGKRWLAQLGKTKDDMQGGSKLIFLYTFIFIFIICLVTALVIYVTGTHTFWGAKKVGIMLGVGIAFTTNAINSMFQMRKWELIFIDSGYHVVGIIISAVILGLWR